METAIELLSLAVTAMLGSAAGVGIAVWFARSRPVQVTVPEVQFNPEGKHYHIFDRTLAGKVGWHCVCGTRAPENKQPANWRKSQ